MAEFQDNDRMGLRAGGARQREEDCPFPMRVVLLHGEKCIHCHYRGGERWGLRKIRRWNYRQELSGNSYTKSPWRASYSWWHRHPSPSPDPALFFLLAPGTSRHIRYLLVVCPLASQAGILSGFPVVSPGPRTVLALSRPWHLVGPQ